ncbi:MAG: PaaI family thioesterase [Cohaesibacteraceae bacterium]
MTLEELSQLIAIAEFHKVLEVKPIAADPAGKVTLHLPFKPTYTIFKKQGSYHGGVIASLVDVAGAMACSVLQGHPTPTANLRVDYLKSPAKCDLYADGEARRVGSTIGVADVTIRDEQGTVYALGRGTFTTAKSDPKLFKR